MFNENDLIESMELSISIIKKVMMVGFFVRFYFVLMVDGYYGYLLEIHDVGNVCM